MLVAVARRVLVSPWKPSLLTKDNNTKELKYNQTQPNSTEPIKTFLWIRLKPIPGFKDWPAVATVVEVEAHGREQSSNQQAQTVTEPWCPRSGHQVGGRPPPAAPPRFQLIPPQCSPLRSWRPFHVSSWGRFSRRRSFGPAGRAPRPFL